jgi:hypothetical protein
MRMQFFGDSHYVMKRFLLDTPGDGEPWSAYPMFTHEVTDTDVAQCEAFLGVEVGSTSAVAPGLRPDGTLGATPEA